MQTRSMTHYEPGDTYLTEKLKGKAEWTLIQDAYAKLVERGPMPDILWDLPQKVPSDGGGKAATTETHIT